MKTVEGFRMRQLGKDYIIVGEGLKLINFNKMIALNETAAYLWRSVEGKDFTVETLRDLLLEEYDVDFQTAEQDAGKVAQMWLESGIITE